MKREKLFIKCRVDGASGLYLIDRLHRQGVPIYNILEGENFLILSIDYLDSKKLFAISNNMCYNISIIKYYGALSPFKFILERLAIITSFIFLFLSAYAFDGWISKIVYEGEGERLYAYIEPTLRANGVRENSFFVADEKQLSYKILQSSDKISFVAIKKSGRTLIVEAYQSTEEPKPIDLKKQAVISEVDGVVTKVNVMSGTLEVEVGDRVKVGQVLIGGYYIDGEEKVKTYALGEVEIKVEYTYFYESFAKGERYKDRAVTLAKESLGDREIVAVEVKEKQKERQTIYEVTVLYTVIVN